MVWWGEDSRFASSVLPSFLQGVGTLQVILVTQGYPPLIDSTIADVATGDLPSTHQHINKILFIMTSWGSLADQGDKNFFYVIGAHQQNVKIESEFLLVFTGFQVSRNTETQKPRNLWLLLVVYQCFSRVTLIVSQVSISFRTSHQQIYKKLLAFLGFSGCRQSWQVSRNCLLVHI